MKHHVVKENLNLKGEGIPENKNEKILKIVPFQNIVSLIYDQDSPPAHYSYQSKVSKKFKH